MVLASDEGLHVGGSVQDCQQTGKGNIGEKQFVGVQGVKSEQALIIIKVSENIITYLAHMDQTLGDSAHEQGVGGVGA